MVNPPPKSSLNAQNIEMRYASLRVLDNLDFSMAAHEAVGIVGPNGAGKTTLLAILSGATVATGGRVLFDGQDISALSAASRCRQGIVRTHQVPKPFSGMSVFENAFVAAGLGGGLGRNEAYDRAVDALRRTGLFHLANRKGETLGLLDRKRMELARALATGPKFLLLDEIGGGLTDAEASELVDTIKELVRRGIGIVWIEHIVHVLTQVVTRLICMDAGKIIADGAPETVMGNPDVVDAYLGGTPL
jgi:branched-chain amino acid transport system ATP-binding protein